MSVAQRTEIIEIRCERCDRVGRLRTARLLAEHGPNASMDEVMRAQVGETPFITSRTVMAAHFRCTPFELHGALHELQQSGQLIEVDSDLGIWCPPDHAAGWWDMAAKTDAVFDDAAERAYGDIVNALRPIYDVTVQCVLNLLVHQGRIEIIKPEGKPAMTDNVRFRRKSA